MGQPAIIGTARLGNAGFEVVVSNRTSGGRRLDSFLNSVELLEFSKEFYHFLMSSDDQRTIRGRTYVKQQTRKMRDYVEFGFLGFSVTMYASRGAQASWLLRLPFTQDMGIQFEDGDYNAGDGWDDDDGGGDW